ncbi:MAG: Asp-tRNA(Asn)/Glu-tRNA(Gln) amidotransferase subunit GatC [Candidatus Micrarchaeaceae archaeon]
MAEYWKIDKELIEHVALLSRLTLSEREKDAYAKQLGEVIGSFSRLDELDVLLADEKPAFHAIELENIWREDVPSKTEWSPLSNSIDKIDGYVKGPKIL